MDPAALGKKKMVGERSISKYEFCRQKEITLMATVLHQTERFQADVSVELRRSISESGKISPRSNNIDRAARKSAAGTARLHQPRSSVAAARRPRRSTTTAA